MAKSKKLPKTTKAGKKNSSFKKIQDFDDSGFGKYQEGNGGGKPFSTSNTRTTRENGRYREANNDTKQPRTDDGKFTYKSVNGESINPEYGPSRGKTVNPLLTGGKNGIKIEDVEKQFKEQKGEYWDKYKDKWYVKGSKAVAGKGDYRTHVAGEAIWEIARQRYDKVKQQFGGKIEWDAQNKEWVSTDNMSEEKVFDEVKQGRKSASEKAAAQEAYMNKGNANVKSAATGGTERKDASAPLTTEKKQYNPHWKANLAPGKGFGHSWTPKMATPTMTTAQYNAQNGRTAQPSAQPSFTMPQSGAQGPVGPLPQASGNQTLQKPQAQNVGASNANIQQGLANIFGNGNAPQQSANTANPSVSMSGLQSFLNKKKGSK